MLVRAADAVKAPVLDKPRAGLVESEGNVCRDALAADRKHPVVIAGAGFVARFAPDGYLFDPGVRYRAMSSGPSSGAQMTSLWRKGAFSSKGSR